VMHDLGALGGVSSEGAAINDSGQVTGTVRLSGNFFIEHAFVYSNGVMTDLTPSNTGVTIARGINSSGQVVGRLTQPDGHYAAFLYSNGVLTNLATQVGGYQSEALGINAVGQVTGWAQELNNTAPAYLYSNGVTTLLGTFGGRNAVGTAVNASGDVTGSADDANVHAHAMLYSHGMLKDLGVLSQGDTCVGLAINTAGQIVGKGNLQEAQSLTHAFIYSNGAMTDLNTLIPASHASAWELNAATGINDAGQITGYGTHIINGLSFGPHAFILTPIVPEPSSITLGALASLILAAWGVRRRARA